MQKTHQVYTLRVIDEHYTPISDSQKKSLIQEYENSLSIKHVVVEYKNGAYMLKANHDIYYAALALGAPIINIIIVGELEVIYDSIINRLKKELLNPMMSAFLYFELIEIGKIKQTEIAKNLNITQGAISNKLRLLKLPIYVQEKILNAEIKERHGRAILKLSNIDNYEITASKIAYKIAKEQLKVVEVEDIIDTILGNKVKVRDALNIIPIDDRAELKNPANGMIIEKINNEVNKTNDEIAALFPLLDIELVQGVDGEDYVFLLKLKGINNG